LVQVHAVAAIDASQWVARQVVEHARASPHRWPGDSRWPLISAFAPTPGGPTSGFDWEETFFFGPPLA
jgi:hypothetical protein